MIRNGGQILVDSLVIQGVDHFSCVPGESFLPVLDALKEASEKIQLTVCRHEAAAGNMAVAFGKLTGRAGVCAVTRGPGATHAAIAVHTAEQDAIPMILLVGQVESAHRGRGGFQEMDLHQSFGSMAKQVLSIDSVERIPETIARAFRIAESGRPGPVVIELPEDMLFASAEVEDWHANAPIHQGPGLGVAKLVSEALASATRPIVLVGRGPWNSTAAEMLDQFAKRNNLPVVAGFRCQDFIDNDSPQYVGHLGLSTDEVLRGRVESADLILAIGGHFGDAEMKGYELLRSQGSGRRVIHVATDPIDVDRFVQADEFVQSSGEAFLNEVAEVTVASRPWADWTTQARDEEVARNAQQLLEGDTFGQIMHYLKDLLPADAILANGAGNYAVWLHQFARYREYGTQLAPASGAMGFGLPAGLMAKSLYPERTVVVFAGDGCFMMSSSELATAVDKGLNVIVIVVNNSMYGTIRLHQERRFPGRTSGTDLSNPSFSDFAKSFGMVGVTTSTLEEFIPAFTEAQASGGPRLIEIMTDPDMAVPGKALSQL